MDRREFLIKSGVGIAGIVLSGKAPAAVVRSLLGSRDPFTVNKEIPTCADYIQDGLLAMWDGIESEFNTSETASKWIDLVSGISLLTRSNDTALFEKVDNHIHFPNGASAYCDIVGLASAMSNKTYTIEMVVRKEYVDTAYMLALGQRDEVSLGWSSSWMEYGACQVWGPGRIQAIPPAYGNIWQWSCGRNGSTLSCRPNNHSSMLTYTTSTAWSTNRLYLNTSQVRESALAARCKTDGNYYHLRVYSRYLDAEEAQHNYYIDKERFGLI